MALLAQAATPKTTKLMADDYRIMVISAGRISGIVDARTTTKEEVGLLMTQHRKEGVVNG